jgi:UDP:flavonoid glycosyltransferase YjiC (YdhE family)
LARYVVAASLIPGHVMPLVEVAADLLQRGHHVTVLAGSDYVAEIASRGMRAVAVPEAARPRRRAGVDRGPALVQRWLRGRIEMQSVFVSPLAAQWHALEDMLRTQRVDAVLCDIAFTGALPMLLTPRARPWVIACGVGPLMLSSADTPPFGMGWQPAPFTDYRRMTWAVHNVLFAGVQSRLDEALRVLGAPRSPVFLTDWPILADRILQFSVPTLEYSRSDLPSSVTFTGPVLPAASSHDEARRKERTRCAGTVVHVTQGTWDNEELGDLLIPTIDGLADREGLSVVATTGRRGETSLYRTVPQNAYVTDYVPYSRLLPEVDVMVSNGGYGGVHQALSHGIPLVIAGAASDKPEVAARVAHAGAGIDLGTSRPTATAVADAVQRILSDPAYREAAERIAREMLCYNAFDHIAETLGALPLVDMAEE